MARPLNRTAIGLNLAAFAGVTLFCLSTDAPLIQQDILRRCQETLLIHRVPIRGLAVDGRDVTLSGGAQSAILSPRVRGAVQRLNGVRVVRTQVLAGNLTAAGDVSKESPGQLPLEPEDVQKKIDRILENQVISFKADSSQSETSALTPESEAALDKIASDLAQAPGVLCEIRGYDSEAAGERQNWVLALQRALATEDYLESKGIADWRLATRAFHLGEGTQGRPGSRAVNLAVDLVVRRRE
jgi:outer membrane protein OmpA-like peptidoglycan-associated protein